MFQACSTERRPRDRPRNIGAAWFAEEGDRAERGLGVSVWTAALRDPDQTRSTIFFDYLVTLVLAGEGLMSVSRDPLMFVRPLCAPCTRCCSMFSLVQDSKRHLLVFEGRT